MSTRVQQVKVFPPISWSCSSVAAQDRNYDDDKAETMCVAPCRSAEPR